MTVCIATYGADDWQRRGLETQERTREHDRDSEVIAIHLPDADLADARMTAAFAASGEWLCFLDADDELAPGYVDAMRQAWMRGANSGDWVPLLVPAIQYVRSWGHEAEAEIPSWDRSIYDVNCACIGTLVQRRLFIESGGFGDEPIYEDWALWLKLIADGGVRLVPARDAVYRYHVDAGSLRNQQTLELRTETYQAVRRRFAHVPADVWERAKG